MSIGKSLFWSVRLFLIFERCRVIRRFYPSSIRFAVLDIVMDCMYLFSNPFSICRRHFQKAGEQNIHLYGETPMTAWKAIAELAGISQTDRFVDLGCGRGRICFWTHLWFGCKTTGVDCVFPFIARARALASLFRMKPAVRFVQGKIAEADLSGATVVYLYTFHPDEELVDFQKLQSKARVITVSEPIARDGFALLKSMQVPFPWGLSDIYVNQKI